MPFTHCLAGTALTNFYYTVPFPILSPLRVCSLLLWFFYLYFSLFIIQIDSHLQDGTNLGSRPGSIPSHSSRCRFSGHRQIGLCHTASLYIYIYKERKRVLYSNESSQVSKRAEVQKRRTKFLHQKPPLESVSCLFSRSKSNPLRIVPKCVPSLLAKRLLLFRAVHITWLYVFEN